MPSFPCRRCGCSSERDNFGDRVCFCDSCKSRGCVFAPPYARHKNKAGMQEPSDGKSGVEHDSGDRIQTPGPDPPAPVELVFEEDHAARVDTPLCSDGARDEDCVSYEEMGLSEHVLRGIWSYDIPADPCALFRRCLRPIANRNDTICVAQSRKDRDISLVIASIQCMDISRNKPQILVICPSKRRTLQIHKLAHGFGALASAKCASLVGGSSVRGAVDALRRGNHFVVGTPGRVYDMICKRHLVVDGLRAVVFEDPDILFSASLKDQCYDIFKTLPVDVQVCVFGARLRPDTRSTLQRFMRDTVEVRMPPRS